MKRLLMNLFQGQSVPLHYASLLPINVTRKMHAHIPEQKYICNLTLTVGSCVVSEFCATRKLHENRQTHQMIFLRFDLVIHK